MTDLVHDRKESAGEVVAEVPQADTHIAVSNHRAEWMLHYIETSRLHVESKRRSDCFHELALTVDWKFARERGFTSVTPRRDHRNELFLELREQFRNTIGGHAGLVVVEERIGSVSDETDFIVFPSRQRQHPFEPL